MPEIQCPKHMTYGPCGGVRSDLTCELGTGPCPFATVEPADWDGPVTAGRVPDAVTDAGGRPVVLTDLIVPPYDAEALRGTTRELAGSCDAVLLGQYHDEPTFPPTMLAAIVAGAGGRPWITLSCRDRNRVVLEQDLAGLAAVGTDAVFCVTGDARGPGVRPDVTQVFDLDGTRLAALAAAAGLPVAVPEAPDAPPLGRRPGRLAGKQRAGAGVAVLNPAGSPERVRDFVDATRARGATLPILAGVPVYTDEAGARHLRAFPGLELDAELVGAVLDADDPVAAGIDAAVSHAAALCALPGVAGVNLSGRGTTGSDRFAAEIKAEIGRRIHALADGTPGAG